MLTLIKTDLDKDIKQRLIRMTLDIRMLVMMTNPEIRAVYPELLAMRNRLSQLLDQVDEDGF